MDGVAKFERRLDFALAKFKRTDFRSVASLAETRALRSGHCLLLRTNVEVHVVSSSKDYN